MTTYESQIPFSIEFSTLLLQIQNLKRFSIVRHHATRTGLPLARREPLKELNVAANAPYREDPIMA